ncbi:DUF4249 domain-containing protein [Ohtaekwangia koreensis]|uniref:DUF4249 domain-containing protein n=1 Tax=Ohtaekwangia koreensis TaxID=688867 RepID=A0A1T5MLW2_9BACT|nr:DUF4249 domain-containing protein [Ohtaekwangia koreensis]SKC89227.1 protein of unknown function [Ohtaekwangia koreensis]
MILKSLYKQLLGIVLTASLFYSCEETVNPDLEDAEPRLVVDAWLTNKVEDQFVKLSWTQPYLENALPTGISGATVVVTYDGGEITFTEDAEETGTYRWTPTEATSAEVFGAIGRNYTLRIVTGNETFEATSRINRTVPIDSITFKFEENDPQYPDNSYTAEFWATDPVGKGDTYWIRSYKNGVALNKPSEINVAYDAGFTAGGNFDGVTFLPPLRSVNPDEVDEDDVAISPYEPGDSVYVEIHSVTLAAYNFLNEVIIQTDRPGGFAELFSTPLANVSTNIVNVDPNGSKALGFFNVSAVSGLGKKLDE